VLALLAGALSATGCAYFDHEPKPYRPPVNYTAAELATEAPGVDTGQHLYQRTARTATATTAEGRGRAPT
jgi:hypothetical protein